MTEACLVGLRLEDMWNNCCFLHVGWSIQYLPENIYVNTKIMFPCQNGTKMRYKPKKLDIFEVKMKISIEYTIIKILYILLKFWLL